MMRRRVRALFFLFASHCNDAATSAGADHVTRSSTRPRRGNTRELRFVVLLLIALVADFGLRAARTLLASTAIVVDARVRAIVFAFVRLTGVSVVLCLSSRPYLLAFVLCVCQFMHCIVGRCIEILCHRYFYVRHRRFYVRVIV